MARPLPRKTSKIIPFDGKLETYFVFHIKRHGSEEIHIDEVLASGANAARAVANARFADSTILHIRSDNKALKAEQESGYPSARFINGKFHAATFADEEVLSEHID